MKKTNIIIRSALILLIAVLFVKVVDSADKLTDTIDSTNELRSELEEKKQTVQELKNSLDEPVDRDYIIQIAWENGYRMPGEIIFNNDLPK